MSYAQFTVKRLDAVIGRRLFNACWFVTSIGVSILQMRLVARAWYQSGLVLALAPIAVAWMTGALLAAVLLGRQRQSAPRFWGSGLLICALLELALPLTERLALQVWIALGELALLAFFFGLLSTAWLVQRRPWPAVDEWVVLARGALSTMLALGAVWLVPQWSGVLDLICLSPLLLLDCWPTARSPLPTPGRMVDNWFDTTEGANRWRVQLNASWLLRGGWWRYLAQRGQLALVILASSLSILLGSIWSVLPTPFAGVLLRQGALSTLLWMIAGQVLAVALTLGLVGVLRGVLGPADRLIPARWRQSCWAVALCMPFVMAASLLALGLPMLQAPWWLALSLSLYTAAATVWGILLPRLRPSLSTVIFSQRHLIQRQRSGQLDKGHLAYERAQEEYVNRFLFAAEGLLTILLVPLVSWLSDRWSVDGVLVAAGRFILLFLVLSVAAIGLQREIRYRRVESMEQAARQIQWKPPQSAITEPLEPLAMNGEQAFFDDVRLFLQQRHYEQEP